MYLHTMEPKTPEALHARLTQMEKIDLRRASADRIDHLARTVYAQECGADPIHLTKVRVLCDKDLADYDALPNLEATGGYIPSTWKF